MIFNSKSDFEEYLSNNNLEMIGDYPSNYIEDNRNYKIGLLLGTKDVLKYHIKIDTDAGYPMAVIFDNKEQVSVISLRQV